jgi:signal transduction histidine kinase
VGLGLSTTLGIVEHHRGRLTIEDTGPQGTTFRIQLPFDASDGGREALP